MNYIEFNNEKEKYKLLLKIDKNITQIIFENNNFLLDKNNHLLIAKTMMLYISIFKSIPPEHIWNFKYHLHFQDHIINKNIILKEMNGQIHKYIITDNNSTAINILNNLNLNKNNILLINSNGIINNNTKLLNLTTEIIYIVDKSNQTFS